MSLLSDYRNGWCWVLYEKDENDFFKGILFLLDDIKLF
jgi:hypothetical protein